jgi:hypothetical protein
VALPTSAPGACTVLGASTTEGQASLSADGRFAVVPCYDTAVGTTSTTVVGASGPPRVCARVSASGTVDTTTSVPRSSMTSNVRAAASADGSGCYLAGASTGIVYVAFGSASGTLISSTSTINRALGFNYDGSQLVFTTSSTLTRGMYSLPGVPTAGLATATSFANFGNVGAPSGFVFAAPQIAYVCDDSSGLYKWTGPGGTSTTVAPSWAYSAVKAINCRGLAGRDEGGTFVLYYTTTTASANSLVRFDTGTNASTVIAVAPALTVFRGVLLPPSSGVAATVTPTQTGTPSASGSGTPSSSGTGTPSGSSTGTPSGSSTGTPSRSSTGTPSSSHGGTPSPSQTRTPSPSSTGTPSASQVPSPCPAVPAPVLVARTGSAVSSPHLLWHASYATATGATLVGTASSPATGYELWSVGVAVTGGSAACPGTVGASVATVAPLDEPLPGTASSAPANISYVPLGSSGGGGEGLAYFSGRTVAGDDASAAAWVATGDGACAVTFATEGGAPAPVAPVRFVAGRAWTGGLTFRDAAGAYFATTPAALLPASRAAACGGAPLTVAPVDPAGDAFLSHPHLSGWTRCGGRLWAVGTPPGSAFGAPLQLWYSADLTSPSMTALPAADLAVTAPSGALACWGGDKLLAGRAAAGPLAVVDAADPAGSPLGAVGPATQVAAASCSTYRPTATAGAPRCRLQRVRRARCCAPTRGP